MIERGATNDDDFDDEEEEGQSEDDSEMSSHLVREKTKLSEAPSSKEKGN